MAFFARPASTAGSFWPSIRAWSIALPETPVMPVAIEENLNSGAFQHLSQPLDFAWSLVRHGGARPVRSHSWRIFSRRDEATVEQAVRP